MKNVPHVSGEEEKELEEPGVIIWSGTYTLENVSPNIFDSKTNLGTQISGGTNCDIQNRVYPLKFERAGRQHARKETSMY
jgi:hypothetical protein